jgi:hypothetical protein
LLNVKSILWVLTNVSCDKWTKNYQYAFTENIGDIAISISISYWKWVSNTLLNMKCMTHAYIYVFILTCFVKSGSDCGSGLQKLQGIQGTVAA